jgi:glycosyltransferase involved in cell wall biosynthesis
VNILFIATRAPYGKMHGHKMGMRTYIRALQALGHQVVIAAFDVPGDAVKEEDLNAKTYYLPLPSRGRILANILQSGISGRLSLNECLYASDDAADRIRRIAQAHAIDFVVADMIRTASYAERTNLPWMIDHEDLLSERYAMWARNSSGNENILGYLTDAVPAAARPATRAVFRALLTRESATLEHRELYWTERALASSLRSMEETERLQGRASRRVFCMPVSVPVPDQAAHSLQRRPATAVFTGGLTYQPNLDALRAYVKDIIPEFERQGVTLPVLKVIGAAPAELRAGIEHPAVQFLGYVPDVNEELRAAQVFFAPIVSGTGIKTKVLEAMACGLPLVALPAGLTGLTGEAGRDYLLARDPADFVAQYERVNHDPAFAEEIGRAGRRLAIDSYSIEAATRILGVQLGAIEADLRRAEHDRGEAVRPAMRPPGEGAMAAE